MRMGRTCHSSGNGTSQPWPRAMRPHTPQSGLKRPNPVLAIVSAENRAIHVIERATRFPELAAAGGGQSLENLLEFIDRLAPALADRAILPGLDRFWKKGLTAGLVRHRPEEHTSRQKWLHHWYSSEGHQEDR